MATGALDTNLLQTNKRGKQGDSPGSMAQGRIAVSRKKILKGVAYAAFFLWALVTFTVLKIPDSAVANFLLNTLNQNTPYQWQAEKISIGFFPSVHLKMEKLSMEPKFPGGGPPIHLDDAKIYPNPFLLIPFGGAPTFGGSFKTNAYKSLVTGSFGAGTNMSLKVETESLDLGKITPLTSMGVDLKGVVSALYLQLALPGQRLGMAEGEVQLKAKNVVFDPASLALPMALPVLNLGDVDVQGTVTRGQLKIDKFKLGSAGKDLEIQIPSGTVVLSDVMPNTRYELHLLIKPSATMEKAVPGVGAMLASFATVKPDGFYAMKLQGTLATPAFPMKD
jgi:type II secretion system protein N